MCHVWTAPSWQGLFTVQLVGCGHAFGLSARFASMTNNNQPIGQKHHDRRMVRQTGPGPLRFSLVPRSSVEDGMISVSAARSADDFEIIAEFDRKFGQCTACPNSSAGC